MTAYAKPHATAQKAGTRPFDAVYRKLSDYPETEIHNALARVYENRKTSAKLDDLILFVRMEIESSRQESVTVPCDAVPREPITAETTRTEREAWAIRYLSSREQTTILALNREKVKEARDAQKLATMNAAHRELAKPIQARCADIVERMKQPKLRMTG